MSRELQRDAALMYYVCAERCTRLCKDHMDTFEATVLQSVKIWTQTLDGQCFLLAPGRDPELISS